MDWGYLDFALLYAIDRFKRFLATSENAVRSRIWHAVATDVLIVIVRKELKLDASLYTRLQILPVSIFEQLRFHAPFSSISISTQMTGRLPLTD